MMSGINPAEINQLLPWLVIILQLSMFSLIILRQLKVLEANTLGKAPGVVQPTSPSTAQLPPVPKPPTPPPCPPPKPEPSPIDTTAVDRGLVDFIKKEEGFRAKAYWDYKQWSIGYGTRASGPNEVITEIEATTRLDQEIAKADALVAGKYSGLPKGIHQALTDLTYNAGPGWEQHSLGAAVTAQKWDTVKADILQYNHAGGEVNAGLTARRQAEVSWFDNPL